MMPDPSGNQKEPRIRIQSLALTGLFILAVLYTAYFARSVLLPLTMALFFTLLLRPLVRLLKRIRIPEIAGSAVVLITFLAITGYGISNLSDPARSWIDKAPQTMHQIRQRMQGFMSPFSKASQTAEELKKMTGQEKKPPVAVKSGPGLTETIVSSVRAFFGQAAIMLILLFFFLASGDLFLHKLMTFYESEEKKQQVWDIAREVEHSISRYLLTVTIINLCEGGLVALALFLLGMPDPVLWGAMAALLVYVPYLGPLVGISIVTVVALFTVHELKIALLAPAIYLGIEIVQGQFLTPLILGARFEMNPVVIFVWLIVWGAIWGVIGAIMAVPMLTIFKILCDRIDALKPVSVFLSD